MKVKVFEGDSLELVLQQIKAEFGESYTIIYQDIVEKRSIIPFRRKKRYVLLVEKREEALEYYTREEGSYTAKEKAFSTVFEAYMEEDEEEKVNSDSQTYAQPPKKEIKETVYTTAKKINYQSDNLEDSVLNEFTGKSLDLIRLLIDRDVDVDVAVEVVRQSCGFEVDSNKLDLKHYTFRESLLEGIEKTVSFAGDIFQKDRDTKKRKVYAFLGPTGVGKTTNLFKIASRLVLEQGRKIGVISTDIFKAGAGEQIRGYTNILKIPYGIFSDPKKLRETLDDWSDLEVILIDTIGRSHYDHWKIGEMREVLKYADEVDYIITLSCNMNKKEMYNIVERFRKFFDIRYIFFTKIDETSYPGALINIPVKTGLKLTYISTGQNVPEDIKVLNPNRLVSYLLMERQ